ncbi:MAG: type II CAAX endopeptidase family protein [Candidatus Micrarchaeaceae archaeon]
MTLLLSNKSASQRSIRNRDKYSKTARKKRSASASVPALSNRFIKSLFYVATFILIILFPLFGWLYSHNVITSISFEANSTIALSLLFPMLVFSYLLHKGLGFGSIVESLHLNSSAFTIKAIAAGVALFAAIFLLEVGFSAFQTVTHIPIPTNVLALLQGMPFYLLVFSVVIAPIDEEILFRGFLVPRVGIILSALIFSLFHISYLSVSEFVAAFIFGLLAGYVFKKTKSLYATIIGHGLVNLLTILVLFL